MRALTAAALLASCALPALYACSGVGESAPGADAGTKGEASTDAGADAAQDAPTPPPGVDASPESGPLSGVMLLGGSTATGDTGLANVSLADGWIWDGTSWTDLGFVLPGALDLFAVASLHGSPVVFGGVRRSANAQPVVLGDTLTWDGKRFQTQTTLGAPGTRCGAAAATLGDTVVLFGGDQQDLYAGISAYLGDTWTWDGATWTEPYPSVSPPPRAFAAAATLGGTVVLYGGVGQTDAGSNLYDTWTWNGANWAEVTAGGGPQLSQPMMASLGNTVALYGFGASGPQTWLWDGHAWTGTNATGPNWISAMAGLGGQAFLFGGSGIAEFFFEDAAGLWTFDGNQWAPPVWPAPTARINAGMVPVGSGAD